MKMLTHLVAICTSLLILVALILLPGDQRANAVGNADSAKADAFGSALQHPGRSRRPVWTSAHSNGAAVTIHFATTIRINGTRIRGATRKLRIIAARLEFSDGSTLAVRTNSRGDVALGFTPRSVRWIRLKVNQVAAGQQAVGLSGWTVRRANTTPVLTGALVRTASTLKVSSGVVTGSRWTASSERTRQWVQLRWSTPAQVSAVRIVGGASSASESIGSGRLEFADGSQIAVGTLEPKGGASTTIAFTPRITTSIRFVVTAVNGGGVAKLQSIRAYPVGEIPGTKEVSTPAYKLGWTEASSCSSVTANGPTVDLRLLCPSNGTKVGKSLRLVVSGPAGETVEVRGWRPGGTGSAIFLVATGAISEQGIARLQVPTERLTHGPTAVRVTAGGVRVPLYVQFVNASGTSKPTRASAVTRGMDLKFDDEFDQPLSATRTGASASYASGKPNWYGVDDFGDAIFAQPNGSPRTSSTMTGGYLRIPARALGSSESDPAGYGRRASAGLLSSAHAGGSGFSAQYGYFEVRMLGPAGAGTWPAFWLLSTGSLARGGSTAEVDAVELYGGNPSMAFETSHSWVSHKDVLGKTVASKLPGGGNWALSWHTYGAHVLPSGIDYYIDGIKVGHTPPVVHSDEPFFFLVNLALTGEWRTGLAPTGDHADLYIDYIRVWV